MVYIKPKQKQTNELEFLHRFKDSSFFDEYICNYDDCYTFLEEPYTGFGYPDLMFLAWNKKITRLWNQERSNLKQDDIKVVQHLYNINKATTIRTISDELGFSEKQLDNILYRLYNAKMVSAINDLWKLNNIEDLFFLESLVTVEAKLKNWKNALYQASNSKYFSSEVFNLYPKKIISNRILNEYNNNGIGVIAFDKNYTVVKNAKKIKLPITLNGWFFNELIGRWLWNKN